MRTTVAIDKNIATRVMSHADSLGNRSMSSMVDFMLRKICDFVETYGYDALIKIPAAKNSDNAKMRD